jgi:hypothetical protein
MKSLPPPLLALGLSLGVHAFLLSAWDPTPHTRGRWHEAGAMQIRWVHEAAPPTSAAPVQEPARPHARSTEPGAPPQPTKPPPTRPPQTDAAPGSDTEHFWLPHEVDLRALPMAAPDTAPLDNLPWPSEQAIRLRLTISAQGVVLDVTSLGSPAPPPDLLAALQAMFRATAFMPARRHGQDVASLQDIDITP